MFIYLFIYLFIRLSSILSLVLVPLLIFIIIIIITVAPRVGDMPITDLMEVFQGMLDAKAAQGKQLKKDIKVDRRTTVS